MNDDAVRRFERAYWHAFRELDGIRLRHWERYRITLPQLRVLYKIRRNPGITTGELAEALGITVSTTSGLVIKLTDRQLVERTTAPDDRRQAPLQLTAEGKMLAGEISGMGHLFTQQVARQLGPHLAAATAALEQVAAAAEVAARSQPTADVAEQ